MMVRTPAHQQLIDNLRRQARQAQGELNGVDDGIVELKAQRAHWEKELGKLPLDDDLEEMTHENLAMLVEENGVADVPDDLMFDGTASPYSKDEDADGHIATAEIALGVE